MSKDLEKVRNEPGDYLQKNLPRKRRGSTRAPPETGTSQVGSKASESPCAYSKGKEMETGTDDEVTGDKLYRPFQGLSRTLAFPWSEVLREGVIDLICTCERSLRHPRVGPETMRWDVPAQAAREEAKKGQGTDSLKGEAGNSRSRDFRG